MLKSQNSQQSSWWQSYKQDWRENWRMWLAVHVPACALAVATTIWFS